MPLPEFFGICGRYNPRPCKIAWASTDSNPRVGTYPEQFLPTRRTIWHATTQGGYSFTPPVVSPGETFGLPTVGLFTGTGLFSIQFDVFSPTSRFVFNFVRTANRLNVAHILTQAEVDAANLTDDQSTGITEIDVGEFVYDAIAATDTREEIVTDLTDEDIAALGDIQSAGDRIFRKLFEQEFANNRLSGVRVNSEGIEYRLDNGGPKAISALDDSGRGFFVGSGAANTYRDGTSRILRVNLKEPVNYGASNRPIRAGDVIYLSYIAVREHYIRESVNVKWSLAAQSLPAPQCYGYPTKLKHAAFRFYQWNVNPDNPNDSPVRVSGWRAVESDNTPVSYMAMMGTPGAAVLGDLMIGGGAGQLTVPYMPTNVTISELQAYIQNRASLPTYSVNVSSADKYHANVGKTGQQTNTYENAAWYNRRSYTTYQEPTDAQEKVFFNVHPLALLKRDVDKFAIEQTLAQEIEIDIAAGRQTFVPFMDDGDPAFPNPTAGAKDYLSSSNTKFEPVQPVSRWNIGNAEAECGVGGGVALGFNSGFNGFGDVLGAFGVHSNIITERFEKDTRILVEKFVTEGEFAPGILAIEGLSAPRGAVSCVTDHMGLNAFAIHSDEEGVLRYMRFKDDDIIDSFRFLEYRPDMSAPLVDGNTEPAPDQFEPLLGYTGMLGDTPGIKPGRAVTMSVLLDKSKFKYVTTSAQRLRQVIPNGNDIEDSQITLATIEKQTNKVIIPLSTGWHGRLLLEYKYTRSAQELLLLFKSGSIVGAADSIVIQNTEAVADTLKLDFRWIKCDTIEIVGTDLTYFDVKSVVVSGLDDTVAGDFLADPALASRNDADKNLIAENRFYDKNILVETDVMTIGRSREDKLFVFFNDRDGGISCAQSNDRGRSWVYHYGIVEPVREIRAQNPFLVDAEERDVGYLFFQLNGKVMCKTIHYKQFRLEDSMVVERFEQDRLEVSSNDSSPDTINLGLYSNDGNVLRRGDLSYVAAGDLTDSDFLALLGKNPEQGESNPNEEYSVEVSDGSYETLTQRSNPVAIGSMTGFNNQDLTDSFFSVSHSDRGELALWYLADTRDGYGGGNQLQCHFSRDAGITWYDKWEFIENSYNRLRADRDKLTQFIDWTASGDPVEDIFADDPFESQQQAYWGLNVHWSRLKRHKVSADSTAYTDESQVLEVSSPYAFFHPFLRQIFLFYIYEGCLLCKVFHEGVMEAAAERKRKRATGNLPAEDELPVGMAYAKKIIEQESRSYFIDGNLSTADIREELHYYVNPETFERQVQGNIIFPFIDALGVFNEERNISTQRVCAYRYSVCNLRVFYKLEQSPDLRCATWNGSNWFVEELMKEVGLQPPEVPDVSNVTDVTGGFGDSGYGPI